MTVAAKMAIAAIRGYQLLISPYLGRNCRFYPTCSQYAAEVIAVHGFLKGSFLAARRICRCAPWHPGGYDPIPPPDQRRFEGYSTEEGD